MDPSLLQGAQWLSANARLTQPTHRLWMVTPADSGRVALQVESGPLVDVNCRAVFNEVIN